MRRTEISLKLASTPFIAPQLEFAFGIGANILFLVNLDNGTAKDVHFTIKDSAGNILHKVDSVAFGAGYKHNAAIDMIRIRSVSIQGSYKDLADRTHTLDLKSYP